MPNIKLNAKLKAYSYAPFYKDWVRDLDSQIDEASGEIIFDTTDSSTAYVRNYAYLYIGVVDGERYHVVNNEFTINDVNYSIEFYGNTIQYVVTDSIKYVVQNNIFTINEVEYVIKCDALLKPIYVITGNYYVVEEQQFEIDGEQFTLIHAAGKHYVENTNKVRYEISSEETFTILDKTYYLIGIKSHTAQWYPIDISMNNSDVFSKLASMSTLELSHRDDTTYTYDLTLKVYNYNGAEICTQVVRIDLPTEEDIAEIKRLIAQEEQRAIIAEQGLGNRITTIENKIPPTATSSNQLVDTAQMVNYALPKTTRYGARIGLLFDNATQKLKAILYDVSGVELASSEWVEIDLRSLEDAIDGIFALIPPQASAQNQLADKNWVTVNGGKVDDVTINGSSIVTNKIAQIIYEVGLGSDSNNAATVTAIRNFVNSSINAIAAYYITSDVQGNAFATKAALDSGPWYYAGSLRQPTRNDYAIVVADETHGGNSARYTYTENQWAFQYTFNMQFTQAQIDAINSGITAAKVALYDQHIANLNNPHSVTKSQVGLGNVDNTSDLDKPISTAMQTALNGKVPMSREIAGNSLANDITSAMLLDSLGLQFEDVQI